MVNLTRVNDIIENELISIKEQLESIKLKSDNDDYIKIMNKLQNVYAKIHDLLRFINTIKDSMSGKIIKLEDFEIKLNEILENIDLNFDLKDLATTENCWLWEMIYGLNFIRINEHEIAIDNDWEKQISEWVKQKNNAQKRDFPF